MSSATCPACDRPAVIRPVPADCRGLLDGDPATIRFCTRCLQVHPAPDRAVAPDWEPVDVSGALPADPDAAVAVGMLVTFLESLAMHRRDIQGVVRFLEAAGVDPLLALDRIGTTPVLDVDIDIPRRRTQLAQLLGR